MWKLIEIAFEFFHISLYYNVSIVNTYRDNKLNNNTENFISQHCELMHEIKYGFIDDN